MLLRFATPDDADTLHRLIVDLAVYEKEPDAVEVTPSELRSQLEQSSPPFQCLIGEVDGQPVAFALFFHNYSTWRGRPGLYLEDLYVVPEHRGKGFGKQLLVRLGSIAVERGCARMEWAVLTWNTPAIDFYKSLGAQCVSGWNIYRIDPKTLAESASN